MRSLSLSMMVFALMKLCGGASPEQPAVPPMGATAAGAITVTAQHGGVMLAASDDAWIELVTKTDGAVEAYVVDATGAPVPHDHAQVTTVQVQGSDGRPHDVALQWDAPNRRYAGRVEVTPVAAPAEVQVVVRGQPRRARAPQVVVVPPQPPSAVVVATPPQPPSVTVRAPQPPQAAVVVEGPRPPSATVVVEGPRPPSATVVVEAPDPRPSVVVTPPRAGVVVTAPPPPRPGVVVVAPPPPVVVAPPRPAVVVTPPTPRVGVVVEDRHPGRGRGHAYGRRGREGGGTVVVSPPRPGAVVVTPPSPGRVEVRARGGGGGRVEVRGDRGRGRGRD